MTATYKGIADSEFQSVNEMVNEIRRIHSVFDSMNLHGKYFKSYKDFMKHLEKRFTFCEEWGTAPDFFKDEDGNGGYWKTAGGRGNLTFRWGKEGKKWIFILTTAHPDGAFTPQSTLLQSLKYWSCEEAYPDYEYHKAQQVAESVLGRRFRSQEEYVAFSEALKELRKAFRPELLDEEEVANIVPTYPDDEDELTDEQLLDSSTLRRLAASANKLYFDSED